MQDAVPSAIGRAESRIARTAWGDLPPWVDVGEVKRLAWALPDRGRNRKVTLPCDDDQFAADLEHALAADGRSTHVRPDLGECRSGIALVDDDLARGHDEHGEVVGAVASIRDGPGA